MQELESAVNLLQADRKELKMQLALAPKEGISNIQYEELINSVCSLEEICKEEDKKCKEKDVTLSLYAARHQELENSIAALTSLLLERDSHINALSLSNKELQKSDEDRTALESRLKHSEMENERMQDVDMLYNALLIKERDSSGSSRSQLGKR